MPRAARAHVNTPCMYTWQVIELPPNGLIATTTHVRSAALHHLVSAAHGPPARFYKYAGLEGEIVMVAWTALYMAREAYVLARVRWWYVLGGGRLWRLWDWLLWPLVLAAFHQRMVALRVMDACIPNSQVLPRQTCASARGIPRSRCPMPQPLNLQPEVRRHEPRVSG